MELRIVQSTAIPAKAADSVAVPSTDAGAAPHSQHAAITPPEAAALVPDEDFSDLEETRFWEDEGEDVEGRIVVRIVGKYLPAHVFPSDHVERYIHHKLHELFSLAGADRHVSILYIHTECEALNDNPLALLSFRTIFHGLAPNLRLRVGAVYILHPSLTLRLGLWLLSPWLSDSIYSRVAFMSRVEFLADHIPLDEVDLPAFCLEHDRKLEAHPLLDYGFQLDRAAATQHLPLGL
ncbi:hypothetical protein CLOM_g16575 [Closterium sp. NIES-68]|nr:hypothetical protein CLOM_g16575 [Closterium sp. NIES-68]GJP69321.1 hypothetical protein CLOP_g259 [Closterium sp. NIES-67]